MKTLEQIKHSLLEIDRDDIERWLKDRYDDGKENYIFDGDEMIIDDEIYYISGDATITYKDFGGNDEPYYSVFTYEFNLDIETLNQEFKANFFSMFTNPKLL